MAPDEARCARYPASNCSCFCRRSRPIGACSRFSDTLLAAIRCGLPESLLSWPIGRLQSCRDERTHHRCRYSGRVSGRFVLGPEDPVFQNIDLVDVDVVVTDGEGRPVTGLKKEDFDIREDGQPVAVQTFMARTATEAADDDTGRSMVICWTMSRCRANRSTPSRRLPRILRCKPGRQTISVIGFRELDDEPFGDRRAALARIRDTGSACALRSGGFARGRAQAHRQRVAPAGVDGSQTKNSRLHRSAAHLQRHSAGPFRRWLALQRLDRCGRRRRPRKSQHLRVTCGSRASVGRGHRRGHRRDGLSERQRLPADARSDLAGRWPSLPARLLAAGLVEDLHSISVKVARKGVHVLARRQRGN